MAGVTITISELRNHFDEYIRRVKSGEAIMITKYGRPVAEFIPAKMIQDKRRRSRVDPRKKKEGK